MLGLCLDYAWPMLTHACLCQAYARVSIILMKKLPFLSNCVIYCVKYSYRLFSINIAYCLSNARPMLGLCLTYAKLGLCLALVVGGVLYIKLQPLLGLCQPSLAQAKHELWTPLLTTAGQAPLFKYCKLTRVEHSLYFNQ